MTKRTDLTFVYVTYIATTPQKLWAALTNGAQTRKYFFGRRVESTWRVGSPVIYWTSDGTIDIQGKVLACERRRRLSFTFTAPHDTIKRRQLTRATFALKPMGSVVRLTLTHDRLIPQDFEDNPNTFRGLNNGWPAILSNLKTVLETGRSFAFRSARS